MILRNSLPVWKKGSIPFSILAKTYNITEIQELIQINKNAYEKNFRFQEE
jgi:hypothetical protein